MDRELLALIDAKMALVDCDAADLEYPPSENVGYDQPGMIGYSAYAHYYAPLGYTGDLIYTTLEEVVASALQGYQNKTR